MGFWSNLLGTTETSFEIKGKLKFLTTGLTALRSFTFPDTNGEVVTKAAGQALTNKTYEGITLSQALGIGYLEEPINLNLLSWSDTTVLNGGVHSGNNSGDQTITLTGDVTGSGASSFAVTLSTAQAAAHTWASTQTFTLAPVFTDASGTRTALGLVIGTNVQAYSTVLTNFDNLTPTNDYFLQVKAGNWTARSVAQVKVDLGIGTGAALITDTDGTLAANSDLRVATQKATKTYVDAAIAAVPPSFVPTVVASGATFTVPVNYQALFAVTIDVQGTLDVVGTLVGV